MAETLGASHGVPELYRGQLKVSSSGTLTTPKNIITSVLGARLIYHKYRAEHIKRIKLYASIEGLLAGNPPYDPVELAKVGLLHIANFNPLDGRSLYERGANAYWNLINQAEFIANFSLPDPSIGSDAVKFANILAKNFNFVVRKWRSFTTHMNTLSAQLVKFGISALLWPDERDWRWRTIELPKLYIQDQASTDLDQLTCVCMESVFTAQWLVQAYEELKDDPDSPWNRDEVEKLLLNIANTYAKIRGSIFVDWMDLQRALQNGDVTYDMLFSDGIRLISLFYQEYDGKISHYMFHPTFDSGDFIFFVDRQYDSISEAFNIITASPGEFTIHSNRGLGHKIFAPAQAMMQVDCSIVDTAKLAGTLLIRGNSTGSKDFEPIRYYPGVPTNIGTSEFVPNTTGANISQLVGANQYLMQKTQYNIANSGDDPSIADRSVGSISAGQSRERSFREFGVLKNNIAHFYFQLDFVFQNMVRKMCASKKGYPGYEYAAEWKRRCIQEGVPEEIFTNAKPTIFGGLTTMDISATRVAGDGSTLAHLLSLQELMVIAGNLGPKGAKELNRQYVMATMGPDYVRAFLPDDSDVDEMAGGASLAGVENVVMKQGESPIFSPDNEQQSHFVTHLALGMHSIESAKKQEITNIEVDKIFTVLLPHLEEHFVQIQKSPWTEGFIGKVKKSYDFLKEYANLARKNAEREIQAEIRKRQELQSQQQTAMSDAERKDFVVQKDEARKDLKVQSQVQRSSEANQTRAEVMREKVQKDAENERLKISLANQNESIKNASTEELKQKVTETIPETSLYAPE